MLYELSAILSGVILGAAAGLLPALHNNTIASFIISLRTGLSPSLLSLFVVSLACSRLVFEFVPAIFLFIPDENSVLSILPGQRLAMEGKGHFALRLTACSSLFSLLLSLLLLPLALFLFPLLYSSLRPFTAPVLLLASLLLLLTEREPRPIATASAVFILSGILGLVTLRYSYFQDPLLPSFTGLFAIPAILFSLTAKPRHPPAADSAAFPFAQFLPFILAGTLLGFLADLFPGLSSASQVAVFGALLLPATSEGFLSLVSSVATSHLFFSIAALLSAGKARVGATAAVQELLGDISAGDAALLIAAAVVSFSLSVALLLLLAPKLVSLLSRVSHRTLCLVILGFILCIVLLLSGFPGLLILATAACIGAISPLAGVRRTHVMGLILIPAILYQLGL
jgi:putative membrane protein